MRRFAEETAQELRGGEVLLLYGELGAGKTTFVQGLAAALGVRDQVTSPTFTIVGEYRFDGFFAGPAFVAPPSGGAVASAAGGLAPPPPAPSSCLLIHIDLYRLADATAARDPAVQDVLERVGESGRLTVIEWAEKLGSAAPVDAIRIYFHHGEHAGERVVKFAHSN
ncbi:MAG: tRNA (adenosine(37)-N6)-threonylcarbamoyltransferase complex ATPase subunit type 1 TsaE [Candidatus Andersenbacteria bacterium CG10_big_fil_rev_8_21_14_0_10_54_11]|uniref:tRNA threonylcarbamoyladenosine biosynthesis protein TsaE n=1 Tax=Candidatus Andersenbacteria bacterium CG10_big_fil_rev_8_21_14_0_10_54_11 TaxID=1974485 RepID=A0A2M6X065_9BACT|nr:MAG: tRNA (adenosine(37)-N6)-threonylcarbamoyltransferase complex ATPase subunit type 1 TsaE [Candidatus Andersenbacteria bacterium CG10_big_fil_rev_8_21_14_0_10_54_11]